MPERTTKGITRAMSIIKNKKSGAGRLGGSLLIGQDTPFVVTEAYKTLRTNILFTAAALDPETPHKNTLVISSPVPNEGKSTTAANLGIVFAQTNSKILLIDADMRKAVQHQKFRIDNNCGLSNCLVNLDRLTEAIHYNVRKGLDLLTAGPTPPNPSELLSSPAMKKLLDIVCKVYDYVIIDTPPITVVSDALTFAGNTAGLLMVVRPDVCRQADLRRSFDSIELAGIHVLGVVMSDVRQSGGGYYSGYRKYGRYGRYGKYGYSRYGYGPQPGDTKPEDDIK